MGWKFAGACARRTRFLISFSSPRAAARNASVEGLQAGADDYLMKPVDKNELRASLQVGARIIALHRTLAARIQQLEAAASEIRSLKMQLPL